MWKGEERIDVKKKATKNKGTTEGKSE